VFGVRLILKVIAKLTDKADNDCKPADRGTCEEGSENHIDCCDEQSGKSIFLTKFYILLTRAKRHQWFDEIKKHTSYEKVMLFKSSNEDNNVFRLAQEDIVLTTYHELMKSIPFPDKDTIEEFQRQKINVDDAIQHYIDDHMEEDAGLLHKVNWYRVG